VRENLNFIELGKIVVEKNLFSERDEEWDTHIIDEDLVCDYIEPIMATRNNIVDYHSCGFFPERWFDLIVVLRCDNDILYPRLESRGYSQLKITENITAEIMGIVVEEARESYQQNIIMELRSATLEEMEANAELVSKWIQEFERQNNRNDNI